MPDMATINSYTAIISDDKQIIDNVCNHYHYNGTIVYVLLQLIKGEDNKWINEEIRTISTNYIHNLMSQNTGH